MRADLSGATDDNIRCYRGGIVAAGSYTNKDPINLTNAGQDGIRCNRVASSRQARTRIFRTRRGTRYGSPETAISTRMTPTSAELASTPFTPVKTAA